MLTVFMAVLDSRETRPVLGFRPPMRRSSVPAQHDGHAP